MGGRRKQGGVAGSTGYKPVDVVGKKGLGKTGLA